MDQGCDSPSLSLKIPLYEWGQWDWGVLGVFLGYSWDILGVFFAFGSPVGSDALVIHCSLNVPMSKMSQMLGAVDFKAPCRCRMNWT